MTVTTDIIVERLSQQDLEDLSAGGRYRAATQGVSINANRYIVPTTLSNTFRTRIPSA